MQEALALANEVLPTIEGVHEIEIRRVALVKDEEGHIRQTVLTFTERVLLDRASYAQTVEALPEPSPTRWGLTPPLSTDHFGVNVDQARERGVEDTARTLVHEWAHTAVNRRLMAQPDPAAAYALSSQPLGAFESLSYRSPVTGEYVRVTPSGSGVSEHELVAQYAGALFDKALAARGARR